MRVEASELPYAAGEILAETADHVAKVVKFWHDGKLPSSVT